jgi:ribosomal protein S17E
MAPPMTGLPVKKSTIALLVKFFLPSPDTVQRNMKSASNVLVAAKTLQNKVGGNITELVQVARLM